jgi:integrase
MDMNSVTHLPLEKIVTRIEAAELPAQEEVLGKVDATALLGAAEKPALTIEECLKLYWSLAKDKTLGKNADQLRRWKNPRKKAIRNFVSVIGNKPINAITRDDMLDFRQYWFEKIEAGSVTPNSANKDLIHLGDILKTVNKMKRLGLDLPLGELSFKEGEKSTRPPFSDDWIKTKLLSEHSLARLNSEARAILIGMINTGYRPSEACALTSDTIIFDHDVPHISIEPDGRQLKTRHARRKIPLTGVSLEIFKEHRSGFPRYRGKSGLSATINKYLRENGLLESPRHSMYSLRHAFEDRMLAAGIDDRIRRDVFGHTLNRERYGRGASLDQVFNLLQKIAI